MRPLFVFLSLCVAAAADAAELKPFKDDLFAYPATLSSSDGGRFLTVAYDETRDINGRDEVPERKVKRAFVSLGVRSRQQDLSGAKAGDQVSHVAVGSADDAALIVVYLHGQGGTRRQGADDFTFGGNFNRLKNLVAAAGGLYLSPDFSDFGDAGASEIESLVNAYRMRSPRAAVFVACGSMGGNLCWRLARSPDLAKELGGLFLLGSMWDDGFVRSPAFQRRVPVFFGHGSRDGVFPIDRQAALFRDILKADPNYPTRFVSFDGGTHGTPIRMVDWREELNWMLAASR